MNPLSHLRTLASSSIGNLIGGVVFTYPTLLFLIKGGTNASLFLLAVIAIVLLLSAHNNQKIFRREDIFFGFAMSSSLMAILLSQLYHHDLVARYFDSSARFILAIPIVLALRHANIRALALIQYAFPLGAISAYVAVVLSGSDAHYFASTSFLNHIHLGDLALLLGFLSLFSINWFQQDALFIKLFKVIGLVAGLTVSILSSARGGWIAIPVFLGVYLYSHTKGGFLKKAGYFLLITGVLSLFSYWFIQPVHERIGWIYADLTSIKHGNPDGSIGVRLQLWRAALHLIASNPIFGVGADGFGLAMDRLSASGFITPVAASLGKGEVHNETLAQTVRFGIFGLLSILAIYFVPYMLFLRAIKASDNGGSKRAGVMGVCVTLGFFVFGLTVEIFDLKMTAAFYSLTIALLLAIATHQSKDSSCH